MFLSLTLKMILEDGTSLMETGTGQQKIVISNYGAQNRFKG